MSSDEEYKFNPERKYQGLALVVVNFTSGPRERKGSKIDVDYLEKTFNRLGFKVDLFQDQSEQKFESLLNKYSQDEFLKDYDSFAFAISTHGVEFERVDGSKKDVLVHHHAVEMFDGLHFDTKKILDYFSPTKCRALRGKPKLFFIQACRIPSNTATEADRAKGIGFDCGDSPIESRKVHDDKIDKGAQSDRRDGGEPDKRDGGEPDRSIFEDIDIQEDDREGEVSDTDVEDESESDPVDDKPPTSTTQGGQDAGDTLEVLEQRQKEIITNLKTLQNQAWQLSRVYTAGANQIKESKSQATEEKNKTNVLLPESQKAAKEPDLTKGVELHLPADSQGSGDELDPTRGVRLNQREAVNITVVPCHNDMLVMFASPQGLYAFRNKDFGSYMLKFLYESVERFYGHGRLRDNTTNFLDVLRDVTAKMSAKTFFGAKEYTNVPCIVHQLSKDIVFCQGKMMEDSKFTLKFPSSLSMFRS